jgi:metal-dependent amidase/aminoacylase/carboxypeptidase family protein
MDIVEAITYSEQVYWQQLWYFVIMVAQGEKLASVKRFMVREGSLDDIDVALIWHLGT